LSEQLADLKANVDDSQNRLADFEQESGLNGMTLGALGQGAGGGTTTHIPVIDSLDALNQQLTTAKADRIAKEAVYRMTKTQNPEVVGSLASSSGSAHLASGMSVAGSGLGLLQSLRQQQSALRVSYADMLTKYGAHNQRLLETKNQLDSLGRLPKSWQSLMKTLARSMLSQVTKRLEYNRRLRSSNKKQVR
jgi:uncharacterized protein involved in exopolysaccharide biosynthesis